MTEQQRNMDYLNSTGDKFVKSLPRQKSEQLRSKLSDLNDKWRDINLHAEKRQNQVRNLLTLISFVFIASYIVQMLIACEQALMFWVPGTRDTRESSFSEHPPAPPPSIVPQRASFVNSLVRHIEKPDRRA